MKKRVFFLASLFLVSASFLSANLSKKNVEGPITKLDRFLIQEPEIAATGATAIILGYLYWQHPGFYTTIENCLKGACGKGLSVVAWPYNKVKSLIPCCKTKVEAAPVEEVKADVAE